MAESLRDLVVSLSLNTENFTRNIKSVGKQIQEAESYFKLAAAGVDSFENTTEGLTARLSMLERRLSLQKDVVTQYERALAQATSKLTECYNRQTDYAQRLEQARQRQTALSTEVQNASSAYERYRDSLGESDSATIAAKANMEAAQQEYEAACNEVKQLAGQQDALRKATQNAADAVSTQQTHLNKAQASVRETERAIRGCNDALRLSQTNWQAAGDRMKAVDAAVTSLGKQMQLAQSRFRLASAGIKDVDTNAGALSAKLVMLNEKLVLGQRTAAQYAEKLQAAREQLVAAQAANDPEKIRAATDAITDAETALTNAQASVRETEAAIRETNRQLDTARSLWTAAGKSLSDFSVHCESVSKTTGAIGRTLSAMVTAPVMALGATAIKSSIEFESAFTGVRKTVDASEAEFSRLEDTVKRMSTEIATDTTEIANVMATAGQLGIRNDALEGLYPRHDRPGQQHRHRIGGSRFHAGKVRQHHGHGSESVPEPRLHAGGPGQQFCHHRICHHGNGPAPGWCRKTGGPFRSADPRVCDGPFRCRHRSTDGRLGAVQGAGQNGGGCRHWR